MKTWILIRVVLLVVTGMWPFAVFWLAFRSTLSSSGGLINIYVTEEAMTPSQETLR